MAYANKLRERYRREFDGTLAGAIAEHETPQNAYTCPICRKRIQYDEQVAENQGWAAFEDRYVYASCPHKHIFDGKLGIR